MDQILFFNMPWMTWNVFLAGTAVVLARMFATTQGGFRRLTLSLMWLLFVPNTVYLLTDLVHVPEQWHRVSQSGRYVLMAQYTLLLLLGVLTYIKSIHLFRTGLLKSIRLTSRSVLRRILHDRFDLVMLGLNYLIAFGVVMGRMLRTNSWQVVTHPERVMDDVWTIVTNFELMGMVFGFWLITQGMYWMFGSYLGARKVALEMGKF